MLFTVVMPMSLSLFDSGVERLMNNRLSNVGSFSNSALVTFDRTADLYVIELNVVTSTQRVIATKVDMQQFIGVRYLMLCAYTLMPPSAIM